MRSVATKASKGPGTAAKADRMTGFPPILIDGEPASTDDLTYLALVNYGAYTSFSVEDGAARGLGRHLARLEASAVELFGKSPGEDRLRDLMRGRSRGGTPAGCGSACSRPNSGPGRRPGAASPRS